MQAHRASKRNAKRERREAQQKEAAHAAEQQTAALRKGLGRGASPSASPAPEVTLCTSDTYAEFNLFVHITSGAFWPTAR